VRFALVVALAISSVQQQPPKPAAPQLPPATQIGSVGKPPVQGPYEFTSDIGVFLIVVRADKAATFDAAMAKLKLAFAAPTASNERKRQAAGWRVLKSMENAAPVVVTPAASGTPPVGAPIPGAPAAPPAGGPGAPSGRVGGPPVVSPVPSVVVPVPSAATPNGVAPVGPPTVAYFFLIEPVAKKSSYDWIEIMRELAPNDVQSVYDQLKDSVVSATRIGVTELLKMGGS